MVNVVVLECLSSTQKSDIHFFRGAQIAALVANEAPTFIPTEYFDFADIFSLKLALELLEYTRINDHAIELVDHQQPLYGPIYSLEPV